SLYPEQIVDFLALCGDSSDNIPGVRGIGEKTATTLLSEYGDLDNIYNNLDKIKSSWKTKLEEGKDSAYLSQQLAQLKYVENLDEAELPINGDIKRLLEELELKSILNRLFKEDIKTITFNKVANHLIIFPFADKFYTTDGKNIAILKEVDNIKPKYIFNLKELYKITKKFYEQTIDLEIVCWLADPDFGAINLTDKDEPESIAQKIVSKKDYALNVMEQYNMWQLYWEMEHKIIKILAEMETIGIKLDPIKLKESDLKIKSLIDKEKQYIEHIIGEEINLNSPKQLSKIIFEKLKMKPFKKNKTGYSTDEESLRNMIPLNIQYEDLLKAILRHREYSKLVSTYTSKLSEYINPSTGRIHTVFKQTGTATGRLSSQNPNLQNIPQKGDLGAEIRGSFVSEDGYSFVSFDYSQIELRILAEISGDENLKNAFINDLDIHNLTAMSILGIKEDEITKDIRRIAKAVNFGIVYGLSPYGLSRDVGISVGEAKKFIDKYFETYPKVKEYMNNIVINAQKNGHVETLFGRKRFVKDLNSSNSILRQRNERIAINSPIQGTASDIIKMAMIKCYDYLNNNNIDGKMILQIHDELVFEINDK
ncbi:MAG: DNA polymerase I, partial [Deferribacterales bacterium]